MTACNQDKCSQGRGKPCNREACRNAPPPKVFFWWDATVAAVEDFAYCYRARRRMGYSWLRSLCIAFDAAFVQSSEVPK